MWHWRFQRFQQIQLLCVTRADQSILSMSPWRVLSSSTDEMSLSRAPSARGVTGGRAHHSGRATAGRRRHVERRGLYGKVSGFTHRAPDAVGSYKSIICMGGFDLNVSFTQIARFWMSLEYVGYMSTYRPNLRRPKISIEDTACVICVSCVRGKGGKADRRQLRYT